MVKKNYLIKKSLKKIINKPLFLTAAPPAGAEKIFEVWLLRTPLGVATILSVPKMSLDPPPGGLSTLKKIKIIKN